MSLFAQELQALREQRSREGQLARVAAAAASPHAAEIAIRAQTDAKSVLETVDDDSEPGGRCDDLGDYKGEPVAVTPAGGVTQGAERSTPRRRQLLVSTQWSIRAASGSAAIARTNNTPRQPAKSSVRGIVVGNPRHLALQLEEAGTEFQTSVDAASQPMEASVDVKKDESDGSELVAPLPEETDRVNETQPDTQDGEQGAPGETPPVLPEAPAPQQAPQTPARPRLPPPPGASAARPRLPPPPRRQPATAPLPKAEE
jgi:hypothetical protein